MNSEVKLYSTGCPQCKVLKGLLDKKGIPYTCCSDIDEMMGLGITSVPMLQVNGDLMNFQKSMQWAKGETHEN